MSPHEGAWGESPVHVSDRPENHDGTSVVQPRGAEAGYDAAVPDGWLEEFCDLTAARRLKQLEADTARLDRIMWTGYVGREWGDTVDWLCDYGSSVISAWARRGLLPAKVRARRLGGLPATKMFRDPVEARSLANETVTRAIRSFRDDVIPRRWDPNRGASLRTFFIGQCPLHVRNLYRLAVRGDAEITLINDYASGTTVVHGSPEPDPAMLVAARDEAMRAVTDIDDPVLRRIVLLDAADVPYRRIAELVGVPEPLIRGRLYRLRHRGYATAWRSRRRRAATPPPMLPGTGNVAPPRRRSSDIATGRRRRGADVAPRAVTRLEKGRVKSTVTDRSVHHTTTPRNAQHSMTRQAG